MDYREHLERLRKDQRGEDLPDGRVPHSMLYAFVGDVIVGRLSIRHTLNERLRRRGGHVGYSVAPKFRRRGYATEMLRQGLVVCRALGLLRVMATCDDDNEASWRVLEKCGAELGETFVDDENGQNCRRYWIDVASATP